MGKIKLKPNEILIFTDFNNTLVDYENEYNNTVMNIFDEGSYILPHRTIKHNITRALNTFEQRTGLTPVLCLITNASSANIDSNGYPGILQDLRMTFFDHSTFSKEMARSVYETSCERFFKFLVYKENDAYYEINPLADSLDEMFVKKPFGAEALSKRYIEQFRKKESVERILSLYDTDSFDGKFMIFAGDSIKDDYPMKFAETPDSVGKIYIRPGKTTKMKPTIAREFCEAKGVEFVSVHPKTGKRMKIFDETTIKFLSDEEKKILANYSDGDYVLLTNKNSRGFVEGIMQAIDIINSGILKSPDGKSFSF